jgi:hypothetical protein
LGSVVSRRGRGRDRGVSSEEGNGQLVNLEMILFILLGAALGYFAVAHFIVSGGSPA